MEILPKNFAYPTDGRVRTVTTFIACRPRFCGPSRSACSSPWSYFPGQKASLGRRELRRHSFRQHTTEPCAALKVVCHRLQVAGQCPLLRNDVARVMAVPFRNRREGMRINADHNRPDIFQPKLLRRNPATAC